MIRHENNRIPWRLISRPELRVFPTLRSPIGAYFAIITNKWEVGTKVSPGNNLETLQLKFESQDQNFPDVT